MKKFFKQSKKAFTLVELVIVIAVIAVLAGVLIPTFSGIIRKADESADIQMAGAINSALEVLDGKPQSASELIKAIDDAFGAGTYASLAPKSAKYGMHFWYDSSEGQIVLKNYDEIQDALVATGSADSDAAAPMIGFDLLAGGEENKFAENEENSIRMFGHFFLMDNAGGEVGDLLLSIDTLVNHTDYAGILAVRDAENKNKSLIDEIQSRIEKLVIITNDGIFYCADKNPSSVHFAPGITTIPSTHYDTEKAIEPEDAKLPAGIDNISIPSTVTTIEEGAFHVAEGESLEITMPETMADDVAKKAFRANSTNSENVKINIGGKKYRVDEDKIIDTETNEETTLEYSYPAKSFTIKTEDISGSVVFNQNIYVAYEYAGSIQLVTDNFLNENGGDRVSSKAVTWSTDSDFVSVDENGVVTFNDKSKISVDNYIATITAESAVGEAEQTIELQVAFVRGIKFTVAENGGSKEIKIFSNSVDPVNLDLNYVGGKDFAISSVKYITNFTDGYPEGLNMPTAPTLSGSNDLFTVNNTKLSLLGTNDRYNGTGTFSASGAGINATVNVSVKDTTTCPITTTLEHTGEFIYRVGNANALTLGDLFDYNTAKGFTSASDISIKIYDYIQEESDEEIVEITGEDAGYLKATLNLSDADWRASTLQFTNTGIAKIVITADGVESAPLFLEVISATNVTDGSQLGNKNCVLLNDVSISKRIDISSCAWYGNGYTIDVSGVTHEPESKPMISNSCTIYMANATLDNIKIVGAVYPDYGSLASNAYNRAVVYAGNNSNIYNCLIANCATPVRANGAVTIKNTTLKGGSYANLVIYSGQITLENVITINQVGLNDKLNGQEIIGLGIVADPDNSDKTSSLTVNGLTQYNVISKSQADKYIKSDAGNTLKEAMFGSDYIDLQFVDDNGDTWVNTGIISATESFNGDDVNQLAGYKEMSASLMGKSGYVITKVPVAADINADPEKEQAFYYDPVMPTITITYPEKSGNPNYIAKTADSNKFCYYDSSTKEIKISMDEGDSVSFNTSIFAASKFNKTYAFTVTMNGKDYTGKSITFNETGEYTLVYTVYDEYYYKVSGSNIINDDASVYYTKEVKINVSVVREGKSAEFYSNNGTKLTTITKDNKTYLSADGTNIYNPTVEIIMSDGKTDHTSGWYAYFPVFTGVISITDYLDGGMGDAVTYNSSTKELPSGLTPTGDYIGAFTYSSSTKADGVAQYVSGKGLVYSSAKIEANRDETTKKVTYEYKDNVGNYYYYTVSYHAPAQTYTNICVTGDTLVTLADGTQKQIKDVTNEDLLLVWNHFEGKYAAVPSVIISNHGYADNTVIKLTFSDGTEVKAINLHQFFDLDLNEYVSITAETVEQYVGHSFAKQDGAGFTAVTLESFEVSEEYIDAYGILSALHYNILVEGMLSTDIMLEEYALFNYFEMGDGLVFDAEKMQEDIEKYGLYTYDDFADYLTYEQFVGLNMQYFKIAVEKGNYTFEGIIYLIDVYLNS